MPHHSPLRELIWKLAGTLSADRDSSSSTTEIAARSGDRAELSHCVTVAHAEHARAERRFERLDAPRELVGARGALARLRRRSVSVCALPPAVRGQPTSPLQPTPLMGIMGSGQSLPAGRGDADEVVQRSRPSRSSPCATPGSPCPCRPRRQTGRRARGAPGACCAGKVSACAAVRRRQARQRLTRARKWCAPARGGAPPMARRRSGRARRYGPISGAHLLPTR
jgi:hypothetical protein